LLAIAALFAAGCRTPASQTLLERENFQQEKTIEDLQDQVDNIEHDLEQCRRENAALKGRVGGVALPAIESPQIITPAPSTVPNFQPPKIDRGTEAPGEDSPAPPSKSPAQPNGPGQWTPPKTPPPQQSSEDVQPNSGATLSSYEEEAAPGAVRIAIIRLLTNGHQFGGHTRDGYTTVADVGDNGLQVAFSPRDAKNRAVAVEGSVAMVVVDPAISGPEARVARWDFSPEETKAHYRSTLFGKAYRFDLLWPHGAPQHERLKLFVRFTTSDGQRLEAQQPIHVRLPTIAPPDNAEFADAPAPRSESIVAPAPAASNAADDDADEPAPHGSGPSAVAASTAMHSDVPTRAAAHDGVVWKPYR
jgi:uncharacterized coiled-coil protein SlyX